MNGFLKKVFKIGSGFLLFWTALPLAGNAPAPAEVGGEPVRPGFMFATDWNRRRLRPMQPDGCRFHGQTILSSWDVLGRSSEQPSPVKHSGKKKGSICHAVVPMKTSPIRVPDGIPGTVKATTVSSSITTKTK